MFELVKQGWQRWDTVQDATFFAGWGVGGSLLTVSSVEVGFSIPMNPVVMITICVLTGVHLYVGAMYRRGKTPDG